MSAHPAMTRAERVALESAKAFSSSVATGGATVLQVRGGPDSPMLNRIAGLGLERPATEADVERALAAIDPGVTFYVAVAPALGAAVDAGWSCFLALDGDEPAAAAGLYAAELGCDLVVTETGERRTDRPSNSYRNILRAGFVEHAVTAHWRGRR